MSRPRCGTQASTWPRPRTSPSGSWEPSRARRRPPWGAMRRAAVRFRRRREPVRAARTRRASRRSFERAEKKHQAAGPGVLMVLMVGATGFEPATSCSRSRRATGLRYAPPNGEEPLERLVSAPVGIRTPNLLIRSQMLYPVELRALTTHRIALASDRMQTRKIDRAREWVNPINWSMQHAQRIGRPEKRSPRRDAEGNPMGGTRLELVTSTMSTWRSNQLS